MVQHTSPDIFKSCEIEATMISLEFPFAVNVHCVCVHMCVCTCVCAHVCVCVRVCMHIIRLECFQLLYHIFYRFVPYNLVKCDNIVDH